MGRTLVCMASVNGFLFGRGLGMICSQGLSSANLLVMIASTSRIVRLHQDATGRCNESSRVSNVEVR